MKLYKEVCYAYIRMHIFIQKALNKCLCVMIIILKKKIGTECFSYARCYKKLTTSISAFNATDCISGFQTFLITARSKKHILYTTKETYTHRCILFCSVLWWLGKCWSWTPPIIIQTTHGLENRRKNTALCGWYYYLGVRHLSIWFVKWSASDVKVK